MDLSLDFLFCSIDFISVFVPVPYCLDDCGFVVEPEVRQVDSSSSILLSQDCFGYSMAGGFLTTEPPGKPQRMLHVTDVEMNGKGDRVEKWKEESTCLTSGSTTKPQSSRRYGTGTKTEI